MDINSGKIYKEEDLAKFLNAEKVKDEYAKNINDLAKKAGMVTFDIGEKIEIKGCKFKISYINVGKNRITLQGIPLKDK